LAERDEVADKPSDSVIPLAPSVEGTGATCRLPIAHSVIPTGGLRRLQAGVEGSWQVPITAYKSKA